MLLRFLLLLVVSAPAAAATFDCSKARSPDEIAACRTPALSAADSEMVVLEAQVWALEEDRAPPAA